MKNNNNGTSVRDHMRREYPNQEAMFAAYGIDPATRPQAGETDGGADRVPRPIFDGGILRDLLRTHGGQDAEETRSGSGAHVRDHLHREYPTREALLAAYGIDPATYGRMRHDDAIDGEQAGRHGCGG